MAFAQGGHVEAPFGVFLAVEVDGLHGLTGAADGEVAPAAGVGEFDLHGFADFFEQALFGVVHDFEVFEQHVAVEGNAHKATRFFGHGHEVGHLVEEQALFGAAGFIFFGVGVEVGVAEFVDEGQQVAAELVFDAAHFFAGGHTRTFEAAGVVVAPEQQENFVLFGGVFGQQRL